MNLNQPIVIPNSDTIEEQYKISNSNTNNNGRIQFNNNIKYDSISCPYKSFGAHQQSVSYNALDISNNYNNNDSNIYMLLPRNINPNQFN